MAFSKETFERSRLLMGQDMQKKMDSMKGRGYSSGYNDVPESGYLNESQMRNSNPSYGQPSNSVRDIDSLNIPDCVKESFKRDSIDVSAFHPEYKNMKAFDDIVESFTREYEASGPKKAEPQMITETQYKPQYPMNNGGIDYNIIRQIIEECIDRKLNTLNENTIKGIRLKEGKIHLQDHSGNVYSASLEFKGNVNEQKTKKKTL